MSDAAYQILPIEELAPNPQNPKTKPGKQYEQGLAETLKTFGFVSSMSVSCLVTHESAPLLLAEYPNMEGRFVVADGHFRRETLPRLGWKHILLIPGPVTPEGDPELLEKLAGIPKDLRKQYREMVKAGEKLALGTVYPFLNSPVQLAKFALGFDRSRRSYDENAVQSLSKWLMEVDGDREHIQRLMVVKSASLVQMIDQDKQREREERQRQKAEAEAALAQKKAAEAKAKAAEIEARAAAAVDDPEAQQRAEAARLEVKKAEDKLATLTPEAKKAAEKARLREDMKRVPRVYQFTPTADALWSDILGRVKTHPAIAGVEGRALSAAELTVKSFLTALDDAGLGKEDAQAVLLELCVPAGKQALDAAQAARAKAKPAA